MADNIALKIFGITDGDQNPKVYDQAVTRGDLVKYDEELAASGEDNAYIDQLIANHIGVTII